MALSLETLEPFGAQISGVDLSGDVAEADLAAIQAAFEAHSVLVFPDQPLDDAAQIAFTRRLGPLEESLVDTSGQGGYFAKLTNIAAEGGLADPENQRQLFTRANEFWHTDSSFKPVPARASLLAGRVVPPQGGETEFANMRLAYAALPEATRRRIADHVCEHDLARSRELVSPGAMTAAQRAAYPPVRHAMVRASPVNGRKALFIGAHVTRILDLPEGESRALLDELLAFATQPRFVHRHVWTQHDLVLWDNRCVLHRGRPWDRRRYPRFVQRTTIAGTDDYVPLPPERLAGAGRSNSARQAASEDGGAAA